MWLAKIALPVAALGWMLVGCGGLTDQEADEVAVAIGAVMANAPGGELEAIHDCGHVALGVVPQGTRPMQDGLAFMHGNRSGMDLDFEVTCANSGGYAMSCGKNADWATGKVHWEGALELAQGYFELDRHAQWNFRGLQSPVALIDGFGTHEVKAELNNADFDRMSLEYSAQYEGIHIGTIDWTPRAGRIQYTAHVRWENSRMWQFAVDREADVEVDALFSGDGFAQLTVDGDRMYRARLENGNVMYLEE